MKNIESFIQSGILEIYAIGAASPQEIKQVEEMAALHEEVRKEIENITEALKFYSTSNLSAPNNTVKPMIMATVNYEERLKKGEQPAFPPILNNDSKISDYAEWLNRKDMILPKDFNEVYVKLIGYTPEATTAIVWLSTETPYEVHTDEHEKFLVVEGTCNIDIDGEIHNLVPGDYISIPLHAGHIAKVTSPIPCKFILQRVAA